VGKLNRVESLMLCTLALGCSSQRIQSGEQPRGQAAAAQRASPAPETAATDPRFDEAGKLKPSGQHASWVDVPSGFRVQPGSTPRAAVFEAPDMPLAKVTDYFETRLAPGSIDLRSNGVVYRSAKARHTQLPLSPVHVTVLEIDRDKRLVRVIVDDLTPSTEPPLPPDVAARELARERNTIE
jgi:hypothetical protein